MAIRVKDGKLLKHSMNPVEPPTGYYDFAKQYDWCEQYSGEFDKDFSTVWGQAGLIWSFKRKEHLTQFLLTWF